MDLSAYAAPAHTRQSSVTRRLALAMGIVFIAGVGIALGTLFSIAASLDAEDLSDTRFYTERALENRVSASKNYITSYAYWTSAYEHLNGQVDTDWAYRSEEHT